MSKHLRRSLEKKRWSSQEIHDTVKRVQHIKHRHTQANKTLSHVMSLTALLVIVMGNVMVALGLFPLLLSLDGYFLYSLIVLIGLCVGFLFEMLTRTIEHWETHHHLWISLCVPLLAAVSVFMIVGYINPITESLGLTNIHEPWFIALLYGFGLLFPYAVHKFVLGTHYYS